MRQLQDLSTTDLKVRVEKDIALKKRALPV
jgi:hypothetical protein